MIDVQQPIDKRQDEGPMSLVERLQTLQAVVENQHQTLKLHIDALKHRNAEIVKLENERNFYRQKWKGCYAVLEGVRQAPGGSDVIKLARAVVEHDADAPPDIVPDGSRWHDTSAGEIKIKRGGHWEAVDPQPKVVEVGTAYDEES